MESLAQLISNTADGAFAVDYSQKICAWNRAATGLFGYTFAEVLGRPCYEVIAGRDEGGCVFCRAECAVLGCAKANGLPSNYDFCSPPKVGQPRWLNVSIVVMPPRLGARGYLLHIVRPIDRLKRLEEFVQRILSEGARLSTDDPLPAQPSSPNVPLSTRELEILRVLRDGAPAREIAQTLGISHATVRTHIQNILGKLGVHSKLEAVLYTARQQLLP